MRHPFTLLLALALLSACDTSSPSAPSEVSFQTIVQESSTALTQAQHAAVQSQTDWAALWQGIYANLNPVPPLPAVDFGRETVVLVALGTRPNTCYSVEITRARLTGNDVLEVEAVETTPGPGCACGQALTEPVHVIRLPRLTAPLRIVQRAVEASC